MSKIKLTGESSGYVEISAGENAANNTLELPTSGTKIVASDSSNNVNGLGIVTATSFSGDGSALTGIDATSLKDSGDTIRVQANTSGAVVTGVLTATSFSGNATGLSGTPNLNVGVLTATSFSGDGSALTGIAVTSVTGNLTVTSGNLILSSGNGIDFSATSNSSGTMTSELLDDYEEGTFSPSVEGSSTAGTVSYTVRNGKYTKIGNLVHVEIYVNYSSGTGTGSLLIRGLPFTVETANVTFPALSIAFLNGITLSANHTPLFIFSSNNSYIYNYQIPSGGGTNINIPYDGSGAIIISGSYRT